MSDKKALMLTNETPEGREARYFRYKLTAIIVMSVICFIMTAGGTYAWYQPQKETEETKAETTYIEETAVTHHIEEAIVETETALVIEETIASDTEAPIEAFVPYDSVPIGEELQAFVSDKCESLGISPAIVFAMMYHESRYQADVIGDGGNSLGIMQVQPRWHDGRMAELGCYDLLNPYECVTVALDYLGELLDRYDGDIMKALTAYNAGHYKGKITQYAKKVMSEAERIGETNGQN